jgi:hypothetical protein
LSGLQLLSVLQQNALQHVSPEGLRGQEEKGEEGRNGQAAFQTLLKDVL